MSNENINSEVQTRFSISMAVSRFQGKLDLDQDKILAALMEEHKVLYIFYVNKPPLSEIRGIKCI